MTTMVRTRPAETFQLPRAARSKSSGNGLEQRVAQLEAEVVLLRAALQEVLPARRRLSGERQESYAWVVPPAYLHDVGDYAQLDAEELEQQHKISSADFYRRWQSGAADDIPEKIEWSLLYEDWLRTEAGQSMSEVAP